MKRAILLCSLLIPNLVLSQIDSTRHPNDSTRIDTNVVDTVQRPVPPLPFPSPFVDSVSFDRIHQNTPLQYPTRPGLGNLGLDSYSLLPKPSGRNRIGHRIGLPKNPYPFPQGPPPAFDVPVPFTRLEYSMGSQEEQFFMITHTQNITPRWNVAVRYRKFGGPGFYRRQRTNFGKFLFSTNYRTADGRYQVMAAFSADRSRLQQNGGIQDPSVFENDEQNSRGAFRIRLGQARSRSRYDRIHLRQAFFPGGRRFNDSTSQGISLGLFHRAEARQLGLFYRDDNPDAPLHSRVLLDSSATRDEASFEKLENEGGILMQHRKGGEVRGEIRMGFRHRFLRNRLMTSSRSFQDGLAFMRGSIPLEEHRFEARAAYGVHGYGSGDRLLSGSWLIDKGVQDIADSLAISFSYKDRRPAYLQENYRSNHFRWQKELSSVQSLRARVRFGEPETREGFSISHTRQKNAVFYGTDAEPRNAAEALRFFRAQGRQRFRYKKWGFDIHAAWQEEWNSDILRFPQLYLKGDLFFETPLFDRALNARFGVRCRYYSGYKGYAYMPVTRRFYLQNEERIGDYPFIDVYFQGRVGDILFFLELDHGNAGLLGYRYYGAPHYPLRDRMIRAGFKWNLYN